MDKKHNLNSVGQKTPHLKTHSLGEEVAVAVARVDVTQAPESTFFLLSLHLTLVPSLS